MNTQQEVQQAKETLKQNGYFTESLWHVTDVMSKYNCTEDEAQEVLSITFEDEATYEQIWVAMDYAVVTVVK